ncbi:T9SS type A sorting domain-containing protein [Winogradskyella vidalii]|uniref:T9SS type A sorting domain-containing protein n=1 Tax=Winogradskyella vidalii TaxID=2615024 RepID=UPI0015CE27CD|nr:T9SS type A sorting domain-containing protein [Winogradskyella vidalii]
MKKILLTFILTVTFGAMHAYALGYQNDTVTPINNSEYVHSFEHNAVSSLLGIEIKNDLFQDRSFKISPNPSSNKLNIKLLKTSKNTILEVYDVLGKRIHKSTITQLEASVDVSNWKTGVYLVKVSNEKESQTKRFIKQ